MWYKRTANKMYTLWGVSLRHLVHAQGGPTLEFCSIGKELGHLESLGLW